MPAVVVVSAASAAVLLRVQAQVRLVLRALPQPVLPVQARLVLRVVRLVRRALLRVVLLREWAASAALVVA